MSQILPSLKNTYKELQTACFNELVFFTGPPALGKTTLVKKLFEERETDYLHAFIDCYTVANASDLLSQICQAFRIALDIPNKKSSTGQPVALNDFDSELRSCKSIALSKGFKRMFIVMDQIEAFERTPMMTTFCMLCRYNIEDIRLVIISCGGPMDMIHCLADVSPATAVSVQDRCLVVLCDEWSVEDIINWILETSTVRSVDTKIYEKFINNAVNLMVATQTKNPAEIKRMCQDGFEEFVLVHKERRREIEMKQTDHNSSEVLIEEFNDQSVSNFLKTFKMTMNKLSEIKNKWSSEDSETHLPMNTSLLIVAAYVAAYTKPSDDKLNFVKCQRKKSSSRRKITQPEMINRPFTLERLVQIYLALSKQATGDKELHFFYNNDCVLADIERLTNLGILQHVSGSVFSSESRYKLSLNIKKEYVTRIALNNEITLSELQGLTSMTVDSA